MKIKLLNFIALIFILCALKINSQEPVTLISYADLEDPEFYKNIDPYKIKEAYFTYLFQINKLVLLKENKKAISTIMASAEKSYKNGEISKLEQLKIESLYTNLINEINKTGYDVAITENNLKSILNRDINILPEPDTLYKRVSFSLNEFIDYQKKCVPDSISQNLPGFIIRENLLLKYNKYNDIINFYILEKLPLGKKIKEDAKMLLELEEINIFQYSEMICNAYSIELGYFGALNEYNQITVEIEHNYETYKNR